MKAKLLQEKSRALNPLTAKIKEIESAIERLESEFNTNTELLIKASTESDGPAIATLSKKNSVILPRIIQSGFEILGYFFFCPILIINHRTILWTIVRVLSIDSGWVMRTVKHLH